MQNLFSKSLGLERSSWSIWEVRGRGGRGGEKPPKVSESLHHIAEEWGSAESGGQWGGEVWWALKSEVMLSVLNSLVLPKKKGCG